MKKCFYVVLLLLSIFLSNAFSTSLPFDGSFETEIGWTIMDSFTEYISFDKSVSLEGKSSAKLAVNDRSTPYLKSGKFDVKPNLEYGISVYIKTKDANRATIKVEWYNAEGKYLDGIYSGSVNGTKDWSRVEILGKAPNGADKAHVLLRVYGPGVAWFDKLIIMEEGKKLNDGNFGLEEVNAKDFGFNELDSTNALQAAINTGAKKVIVPYTGKEWIVNESIRLISNQEIYLEPGVIILAKKGSFKGTHESLFLVAGKKNITISGYGASLKMQKADYQGPEYEKSEWRHALKLQSCENIQVLGVTICDSGGDGIYVGNAGKNITNKNIVIRDVILDNNHRQGISVITAENLLIENCIIKNTSGTLPMAGIDFEPNVAKECLINCIVRNCLIENNEKKGIHLWAGNLDADTSDISIRVENCRIKGSEMGINIGGIRDDGPKGLIEFINCSIEETSNAGIRLHNKSKSSARVVFEECEIRESALLTAAPIYFSLANSEKQGGVDFKSCTVKHKSFKPFLLVDEMVTKQGLYDVSGNIVVQSPFPVSMELAATDSNEFKLNVTTEFLEFGKKFGHCVITNYPSLNEEMLIRGEAGLLLYATQGEEVKVNVTCVRVGSNRDNLQLFIFSPENELLLQDEIEVGKEKKISFLAQQTGVYYISGYANKNAIKVVTLNPLGFELGAFSTNLYRPTGQIYFLFPGGMTSCRIKVEGGSVAERIKATLIDDKGNIVEERDNISGLEPYTFKVDLDQQNKGEVWSMRFEKPGSGIHENVWISFDTSDIPAASFSSGIVFK